MIDRQMTLFYKYRYTSLLILSSIFFISTLNLAFAKVMPPLSLSQLRIEIEKNKEREKNKEKVVEFSHREIYGEAWVVNSSPSMGEKKLWLVSPDPFSESLLSNQTGAIYLEIPKLPPNVILYPGQKVNIRGKIATEEENEFLENRIFKMSRAAVQILSVEPKNLVLPKTFSISLERQACAGSCPQYKVSLDQTGVAHFEGKENVSALGHKTKIISTENLKRLWEIVEKTKIFALSESYYNENGIDKEGPLYIVKVITPEQSKSVTHEEGNPQAPIKLILLENAIDELLQTKSWVR